jgi:DNA-binding beta-propeller fold protein YncE
LGAGIGSFDDPVSVAVDPDGNVSVADRGNHRVQRFTPTGGWIMTSGSLGTGDGQFNNPTGVASDAAGNLYVVDSNNTRVQVLTPGGAYIRKWGTPGTGPGQFLQPWAIAVAPNGQVYVTDIDQNRILRFTADGDFISAWGTFGSANGQFDSPKGIAVDANGTVYVTDEQNTRIQVFDKAGNFIRTWGSSIFSDPGGVEVDDEGLVFVADVDDSTIQVFTGTGTLVAKMGSFGTGQGQLRAPLDVAVGQDGSISVADSANDRIQRFVVQTPETTATGPSGLIRDTTPTFTLSSPTNGTFQCRVKGSGTGFTACTSPWTTPVLDDGYHVVAVRAIDNHRHIDPTPAEREFRVDATPPQTWFDTTPAASTTDRTPTFRFSASERATFQCSRNGATFSACTSPHTTPTLSLGTHTFRVRAIDRAGNLDPTPASYRFTIRS